MHVDCDPDSNPDSGPGAHVNAAYGPARLHKDSDSDLDPDWLFYMEANWIQIHAYIILKPPLDCDPDSNPYSRSGARVNAPYVTNMLIQPLRVSSDHKKCIHFLIQCPR